MNRLAILSMTLLAILLLGQTAQASSRWDVLSWCSSSSREDVARCGGFLIAALDLRTSHEFPGPKSCFMPSTRLPQVRERVVVWLKENKVVPEQTGLALVSRAIKEQFPCP